MLRTEASQLIENQNTTVCSSAKEVSLSSSAAAIAGSISGTAISALFCSTASLDSTCIGVGAGIGAISGMLTWWGSGAAALVNESFLIPGFITSGTLTTVAMMGVSYALNINPLTVMGFTAAGSAVVGTLAGAASFDHSKKLLSSISMFRPADNSNLNQIVVEKQNQDSMQFNNK